MGFCDVDIQLYFNQYVTPYNQNNLVLDAVKLVALARNEVKANYNNTIIIKVARLILIIVTQILLSQHSWTLCIFYQ